MPAYRLHYFDVRGRGEVARLMFNAAGQKFDDVRYTKETWPAFKPKTPFGQLPVLEVDGKLYGQSGAIFNYLAKELGFYGKGNLEALKVDVVIGLVNDFVPLMIKVFFIEQDEAKKKELKEKLLTEDATKFFTNFEKVLKENGSTGYFVGKELTMADIVVYDLADNLITHNAAIVDPYPLLKANRQKVESNKGIAAYLKSRK
ncbi:probable glutathione S-transferase 7 [Patella vulgata]|uniref:probable glutathione S-transferase 7 n=1 Tax=Patella vulgata TaxID=6465 RepID=UPI00217F4A78|nr:probable glutathione S-transferase 7 [Patella vulgata]